MKLPWRITATQFQRTITAQFIVCGTHSVNFQMLPIRPLHRLLPPNFVQLSNDRHRQWFRG
jgi:hypothetical protein